MRGRTKPKEPKALIQLPQGELLAWLCGGVAFLILAGWAWILKGPSAEQMVGDPGILQDYFHGCVYREILLGVFALKCLILVHVNTNQ